MLTDIILLPMIFLLSSFKSYILSGGPTCQLSSSTKEHTETKSHQSGIPMRRFIKAIGPTATAVAAAVGKSIQQNETAILVVVETVHVFVSTLLVSYGIDKRTGPKSV